MDINQKLVILLRNMNIVTHYKIKTDRSGIKKIVYYLSRNLTDEEARFLREQGIPISDIITHKGLHIFYNINDSIRTGRNHPFIMNENGEMTDCFDPNKKHNKADNNDVYNICKEEYYLRQCEGLDTDACRWLTDRILTIKARHPDVYDYLLLRDILPIPPHYSRRSPTTLVDFSPIHTQRKSRSRRRRSRKRRQ